MTEEEKYGDSYGEQFRKLEEENAALKTYNAKLLKSEIDQHNKIGFLSRKIYTLERQIEKIKECANCPVWLLNQTEKICRDCKHKETLILLRR